MILAKRKNLQPTTEWKLQRRLLELFYQNKANDTGRSIAVHDMNRRFQHQTDHNTSTVHGQDNHQKTKNN